MTIPKPTLDKSMRVFESCRDAFRIIIERDDVEAEPAYEAAGNMAAIVYASDYLPIRQLGIAALMDALDNAPNTAIRGIVQKVVERLLKQLVEENYRLRADESPRDGGDGGNDDGSDGGGGDEGEPRPLPAALLKLAA